MINPVIGAIIPVPHIASKIIGLLFLYHVGSYDLFVLLSGNLCVLCSLGLITAKLSDFCTPATNITALVMLKS